MRTSQILSVYGIGVANNGGGTDGQEYTFGSIPASAGDNILLARSPSAMSSYFDSCFAEFDLVLVATSAILLKMVMMQLNYFIMEVL